jgi:hypothetical protein
MYQTIYKGTVSTYVQLILLEDHEGNGSKLIPNFAHFGSDGCLGALIKSVVPHAEHEYTLYSMCP